MESETLEQIRLSPYAKIKVYWDDKPENYSKAGITKVKNLLYNWLFLQISVNLFSTTEATQFLKMNKSTLNL